MRPFFLLATLLVAMPISSASGQNRFPDRIPTSDLSVLIEDFATIPDSRRNQPPRLSVLAPDPTGRLFVNDQRGPLYNIDSTGANVTEYLDLRDFRELRITSTFEAGFQGFAFHPDFANQGADGFGRLYTIHSSSNRTPEPDFDPGGNTDFHTLLLEWQTNAPTDSTFVPANPDQPYRELIRFKQPFGNHNAGLVAFNYTAESQDADYGNLYIAIGDGGSGNDPQENGEDPSNPYGALLRIDPLGSDGVNGKYGIVADNVLAADGDANTLGEIFAYGLRNPQRFGWDTATGNMYIADIGQNAVEEIDLGVNGGNFGWDHREGSFRLESNNTEGLIDPVAEYDHFNMVSDPPTGIDNRAVTVGEVARNTGIPGLDGQLLLSDFPTGLIFTLDVDNDPLDGGQDGLLELQPLDENLQPVRLLELINKTREARGLRAATRADTRFGINTPGEVYVLNKQDGVVRRLAAVPEQGTQLLAGDADQDLDFDQLDLVRVQIAGKYLTGEAATWGEGDWNGAPGGQVGSPPAGDGLFDQNDIVASQQTAAYLTGPYAAVRTGGQLEDEQTSLVYHADTGELSVDAPVGTTLTSINISSARNKFIGNKPAVLDGAFDNFAADNVFKATFGGSFGSISFGAVLPAQLSENEVAADLSAVGSLAQGGDLGEIDLVYVPEPSGMLLFAMAAILTIGAWRGRQSLDPDSSNALIR